MAGVINVTSGSQAILTLGNTAPLAVPGAAGGMAIPLVQDLTLNTSPGTVNYSVLSNTASKAFTTTVENSVSLNMLLDDEVFFGLDTPGTNQVANDGLWSTSNSKTEVFFSVAFEGTDTDDYYIHGKGFIGGLAPSASMDQAVWISPMEIIVNGDLTKAQVT